MGTGDHIAWQRLDESSLRLGRRACLRRYCEEPFQAEWLYQRFCEEPACDVELFRWLEEKNWSWEQLGPAKEAPTRAEVDYGTRECTRTDCGRSYRARSPSQQYCTTCRAEVDREQARERQRRRREKQGVRQHQTDAERKRRARRQQVSVDAPLASAGNAGAAAPEEGSAPPRGHASHETCQSGRICDRPGCYEPPRLTRGGWSSYCGEECALAMRRVLDRERKWRARRSPEGRLNRRLTDAASARSTGARSPGSARRGRDPPGAGFGRPLSPPP